MKIKVGYSMGYAGTDTEWEEEVPDDVVAAGDEAIDEYLNSAIDDAYEQASQKISTWGEIIK